MARGTAEPAERYLFLFLPGGRENKIDPSLLTVSVKMARYVRVRTPRPHAGPALHLSIYSSLA